ncbi:MAG: hypothetical protein OEM02_14655, partial [Desulfobulbaceae bacterium]|nr:hypothetical protein [Desulfobulbaceae bacterium]
MENDFYQKLTKRIGRDHLSKRLSKQVKYASKVYSKGGYSTFHLENITFLYVSLKFILRTLGLYQRGCNNTLEYRVEKNRVKLTNMNPKFEGFRILQLSDLHFDAIGDGGSKLLELVRGVEADLCVVTGDFRFLDYGDYYYVCHLAKEFFRS